MSNWIKSQYKYVQGVRSRCRSHGSTGDISWMVTLPNVGRDVFETERLAAIAVDKILIKRGKEPINILKRCN